MHSKPLCFYLIGCITCLCHNHLTNDNKRVSQYQLHRGMRRFRFFPVDQLNVSGCCVGTKCINFKGASRMTSRSATLSVFWQSTTYAQLRSRLPALQRSRSFSMAQMIAGLVFNYTLFSFGIVFFSFTLIYSEKSQMLEKNSQSCNRIAHKFSLFSRYLLL